MPPITERSEGIVQVCGRWARLENGDWVTPVKPFHEFDYDVAAFDRAIAEFQRNPVKALEAGIVDRTPSSRKAKDIADVEDAQAHALRFLDRTGFRPRFFDA